MVSVSQKFSTTRAVTVYVIRVNVFEDVNGNDTWDADIGEDGVGGPNDIVLYTVSATYDRLFPFWRMMGWDQEKTITASTVLKNQPFGEQLSSTVTTVCT